MRHSSKAPLSETAHKLKRLGNTASCDVWCSFPPSRDSVLCYSRLFVMFIGYINFPLLPQFLRFCSYACDIDDQALAPTYLRLLPANNITVGLLAFAIPDSAVRDPCSSITSVSCVNHPTFVDETLSILHPKRPFFSFFFVLLPTSCSTLFGAYRKATHLPPGFIQHLSISSFESECIITNTMSPLRFSSAI